MCVCAVQRLSVGLFVVAAAVVGSNNKIVVNRCVGLLVMAG